MSTDRKGTEVLVGLFLLIGFSCIAIMAVMFGRAGQGFQKFYEFTVEFPNASGLVQDSYVLLSGARIGHVAKAPELVGSSYAVSVRLRIREEIKIPRKSSIIVGSSGLLGDRYVDVIPQPGFDPAEVIQPGELIVGTRASGFDDLTVKGSSVMDQLAGEIEQVKIMTVSINERLLNERNLKNLEETFANLRVSTENFVESSKKLGDVLAEAEGAVGSAKQTMKTADAAAGDLRDAIADLRKMAASATKTVESARGLVDSGKVLIKKATEGEGALGLLISDRHTAENLRSFLANLKRSGPVFYKDRPLPPAATPAPRQRTAPRRR